MYAYTQTLGFVHIYDKVEPAIVKTILKIFGDELIDKPKDPITTKEITWQHLLPVFDGNKLTYNHRLATPIAIVNDNEVKILTQVMSKALIINIIDSLRFDDRSVWVKVNKDINLNIITGEIELSTKQTAKQTTKQTTDKEDKTMLNNTDLLSKVFYPTTQIIGNSIKVYLPLTDDTLAKGEIKDDVINLDIIEPKNKEEIKDVYKQIIVDLVKEKTNSKLIFDFDTKVILKKM